MLIYACAELYEVLRKQERSSRNHYMASSHSSYMVEVAEIFQGLTRSKEKRSANAVNHEYLIKVCGDSLDPLDTFQPQEKRTVRSSLTQDAETWMI